uniref:Pentacotripeptide-repeat region of PRORP domain-containing protein n=1 Tax=Hyaloperonospora arabidopsidis (strain Emoy2) TaxID=559515 RepID=M4C2U9_HYAAE
MQELLRQLKRRYGPQFVARVLVDVVNGCANIKMFAAAHELLLYQQTLWSEIRSGTTTTTDETMTTRWSGQSEALMPPSVVGHLMAKMMHKKKHGQVLALARAYFASAAFDPVRDFQQQGFLELFKASVYTQQSPRNVVHVFLDYVEGTCRAAGGNVEKVRTRVLERGFGAAIHCCVKLEEYSLALHCYEVMESTRERLVCAGDDLQVVDAIDEAAERVCIVDEVLPADENIYVNVLKACMAIENFSTFKDAFRGMVARGVARSAGFGSAIRYCHKHLDPVFLEEVLDGVFWTEQKLAGAWTLEVENYNDAFGCFAATNRPDQAKELFSQMLNNPSIVPDHITMLEMVESHRNASIEEVFNLMDVFLEWKLTPNLQVFTSLLSVYMRRREAGNAIALIGAMEEHGIVQDVKAFTTVAFIHASRGDLKGVGDVLRNMASQGVATDRMFFDYVLNALYRSCGIDMCFSLFRELSANELAIPEGLYISLVDLGTTIGLIERTLHIAYNMECEGYHLSSKQLYALMMRCHSDGEISEFVRTFVLLHQGVPPETPRFEVEMYEDLISMLTQFNRKNEVPKVQELARSVGPNKVQMAKAADLFLVDNCAGWQRRS